jgi:hypothetical protein
MCPVRQITVSLWKGALFNHFPIIAILRKFQDQNIETRILPLPSCHTWHQFYTHSCTASHFPLHRRRCKGKWELGATSLTANQHEDYRENLLVVRVRGNVAKSNRDEAGEAKVEASAVSTLEEAV